MTLLHDLNTKELAFFKIKSKTNPIYHTHYKKLTMDCIYSLLFIIYFLEERGYTLTHICLDDFEIVEQHLFLKKDTHLVTLEDIYIYEPAEKKGIEFLPKITRNKWQLHRSVGQFAFWILTHSEIKSEITERDLEPYYYTKPYFFIKNTMNHEPCLIYL